MMWSREVRNGIMHFLWQLDVAELECLNNLYIPEILREKRIINDFDLPEMNQEEKDLLAEHGRIRAIANYRRRTSTSLLQAKSIIDQELYTK